MYIKSSLTLYILIFLQDSLGGNAKTHMIACVHPGARYVTVTLQNQFSEAFAYSEIMLNIEYRE